MRVCGFGHRIAWACTDADMRHFLVVKSHLGLSESQQLQTMKWLVSSKASDELAHGQNPNHPSCPCFVSGAGFRARGPVLGVERSGILHLRHGA
jgi:hypothetical protein